MALVLAAMTVWNLAAVERILNGGYSVNRIELMAFFSRPNVASVFLDTMQSHPVAADVVPDAIAWLQQQGWVYSDTGVCLCEFTTHNHDLGLALLDRFDVPTIRAMTDRERYSFAFHAATCVETGGFVVIRRFAELGLLHDEVWALIISESLRYPHALEYVVKLVRTFIAPDVFPAIFSTGVCREDFVVEYPPVAVEAIDGLAKLVATMEVDAERDPHGALDRSLSRTTPIPV
ncbi:hypothetical protein H9P43_008861 [Blastocladiella emersonii ATCC 22665]|nr:hypothetical protein H9P43_008861 [Blastocladiella emersonii ATCC 22665]